MPESLDEQMIRDADDALEVPEKMQLAYTVRNTDRAIGAKLSSHLTRRFGMTGLSPNYFTVRMRGAAGQSLGAFAVQGLKLEVIGEANDYVGKGLSGGTISLRLATSSPLISNENAIIGNTVLYGATAGKLFAAGQAGERFCVRNSGANAVVEGCGSNGCEYMQFRASRQCRFGGLAAHAKLLLGGRLPRPGARTLWRDPNPLCRASAGGLDA